MRGFLKVSILYFIIAVLIIILATIYNFIMIDKFKININLVYVSSLFIFGFFSYILNAKFNFNQKISVKDYFIFIQNLIFSLIVSLIVGNYLKYFTDISNLYLVCIVTILNSILNYVLNLKRTFKYF